MSPVKRDDITPEAAYAAWIEHGTAVKAAKALGVSKSLIARLGRQHAGDLEDQAAAAEQSGSLLSDDSRLVLQRTSRGHLRRLRGITRQVCLDALNQHGNYTAAARSLGMSPSGLRRYVPTGDWSPFDRVAAEQAAREALDVVRRHDGFHSPAARELGISRAVLRGRLALALGCTPDDVTVEKTKHLPPAPPVDHTPVVEAGADWRLRGVCNQEDPELFFPLSETGALYAAQVAAAKAVCGACPVVDECLRWAVDTGQAFGIWGALTTKERDLLKRREAHARRQAVSA